MENILKIKKKKKKNGFGQYISELPTVNSFFARNMSDEVARSPS